MQGKSEQKALLLTEEGMFEPQARTGVVGALNELRPHCSGFVQRPNHLSFGFAETSPPWKGRELNIRLRRHGRFGLIRT